MVQLFVDGGGFMWPILFIFIIGFVFVGERLYHLIKAMATKFGFAVSLSKKVDEDVNEYICLGNNHSNIN